MAVINIKAKGVKQALLTMDPRMVRTAAFRAINRTSKMARTEGSKRIRERYAIKKSDVDPAIRIYAGTTRSLNARMVITGRPIPLGKFRVSILKRRKGSPGGPPVKARVLKGGKGVRLDYGFYAVMKSGHKGVFQRKGMPGRTMYKRLPIKELYGPSVPSMVSSEKVLKAIRKKVQDNFDRLFTHNLNRLKARRGGR